MARRPMYMQAHYYTPNQDHPRRCRPLAPLWMLGQMRGGVQALRAVCRLREQHCCAVLAHDDLTARQYHAPAIYSCITAR